MILFFDTETTGFIDRNLPLSHEGQPHLVQLAALLTDDDGTERCHVNLIVQPPVAIPKQASDVHGITDDLARRCGVAPLAGFGSFYALALKADLLVAHNIDFDMDLMAAAGHKVGRPKHSVFIGELPVFCTMKAATPICQIPSPYRVGQFKWPRLSECIRHFFGEELEGAHDALVDVRACKRVYFELKTLKEGAKP